jgi:hypothetical protein
LLAAIAGLHCWISCLLLLPLLLLLLLLPLLVLASSIPSDGVDSCVWLPKGYSTRSSRAIATCCGLCNMHLWFLSVL